MGVSVNHSNEEGLSGLELAAFDDVFGVCQLLVRRGATLTAVALERYGAGLEVDEEEEEEEEEDGLGPVAPLSEETKQERRAALLLLLPEHLRRAEELTPFRHAANWRRRRDVMMFLAEGGHRPLSHRVPLGETELDSLTHLTQRIFSEEEGVSHRIMAML